LSTVSPFQSAANQCPEADVGFQFGQVEYCPSAIARGFMLNEADYPGSFAGVVASVNHIAKTLLEDCLKAQRQASFLLRENQRLKDSLSELLGFQKTCLPPYENPEDAKALEEAI
jgi:hypothetical protein